MIIYLESEEPVHNPILHIVYCSISICKISNSSTSPSKWSQKERDPRDGKSSCQNPTREHGGPVCWASLYTHEHPLGTDEYEIIC